MRRMVVEVPEIEVALAAWWRRSTRKQDKSRLRIGFEAKGGGSPVFFAVIIFKTFPPFLMLSQVAVGKCKVEKAGGVKPPAGCCYQFNIFLMIPVVVLVEVVVGATETTAGRFAACMVMTSATFPRPWQSTHCSVSDGSVTRATPMSV